MRVGLLTRFLGYTGIVVGIAGMLLIGSAPAAALEVFFMGALAYLFSGRWPGGEPPAWKTGEAEPWPSSQAVREQRMAARGLGPGPSLRRSLRPSRSPPRLPCGRVRAPRSASASAATERRAPFRTCVRSVCSRSGAVPISTAHSGRVVVASLPNRSCVASPLPIPQTAPSLAMPVA